MQNVDKCPNIGTTVVSGQYICTVPLTSVIEVTESAVFSCLIITLPQPFTAPCSFASLVNTRQMRGDPYRQLRMTIH